MIRLGGIGGMLSCHYYSINYRLHDKSGVKGHVRAKLEVYMLGYALNYRHWIVSQPLHPRSSSFWCRQEETRALILLRPHSSSPSPRKRLPSSSSLLSTSSSSLRCLFDRSGMDPSPRGTSAPAMPSPPTVDAYVSNCTCDRRRSCSWRRFSSSSR